MPAKRIALNERNESYEQNRTNSKYTVLAVSFALDFFREKNSFSRQVFMSFPFSLCMSFYHLFLINTFQLPVGKARFITLQY